MDRSYSILLHAADGYYEEKRSKFYAVAYPVRTEDEALSLIAAERKKTYDARHHCYAYQIGAANELCRFSDDGEPSGTAGKPILEALSGSGLHNTLLIVTRYFGGTLLGTGGLVRAYSTAAKDALGHAEAAVVRPVKKAGISCAYPDLARVDKLLSGSDGVFCGRRSYGETAEITLYLLADQAERFAMSLADATAGRVRLQMTDDAEILTIADRFHSEY